MSYNVLHTQRRSMFLLSFVCGLLSLLIQPVAAQDTFLTVLDALGASYNRPLPDCPTAGIAYTRATNSFSCSGSAESVTSLTITGTTGNTLVVDTTTLVVDATNHRVGIGLTTPTRKLTVSEAQTDPVATSGAASITNVTTLSSGTNAQVLQAISSTSNINQAGQNLTTAQGLRVVDVQATVTGASGTVTGAAGVRTAVVNSGAGTLTTGWGVYASPANSGGGTFGTWTAYDAPATTVGSTNTFAYRGQIAANAVRYNLYMDGTAQNYLAGNLGIGTGKSVALTVLDVADVSTNAVRGIITGQYSASADGGRLIGRKARGTAAVPVVVTTGDTLASWIGEGYDGASYLQMGAILISSTGTIASTRVPTTMVFQTATNAAPSVLTTALTIGADQSATFLTLAGTGAATGKTVVCADTNGKIYRSSSGVACAD